MPENRLIMPVRRARDRAVSKGGVRLINLGADNGVAANLNENTLRSLWRPTSFLQQYPIAQVPDAKTDYGPPQLRLT